ncbi:metallophosphoesterase family protein [Halorhabdus rudnickae]|uniref:metallophosphoesterase family protein n=1 Tax=Halorhabdus rudnickae TaxID=1775544 RepID=UPI00108422DD|nr:metallophosphoesterase [Halorhabdus rudnickae]
MNDGNPGTLLARLDRPTAAAPVRLAAIADPHVSTRADGTSKLFEHTLDHFVTAIEDIEQRDVDAVVSPGDLTKDGETWNADAVEDALDALDVPIYAVPGNHDVPKEGDDHDAIPVAAFADRFGPGGYPFRHQVGELDVLGLNSAGTADRLAETHDGHVDADQREWLARKLQQTDDSLVVVHHNLPSVTEQLRRHRDRVLEDMAIPPTMREPEAFVDVLADGDAALVLTGHLHLPLTGVDRGVREIATPTTCSFPQSYLLLDITPEGTEIRLVPVADVVGLELAHDRRARDSTTARGLTSMGAARLASMPLVIDD